MIPVIKLVIVEDEDLLREGLVHYIDWTSLGFEVVGEASNGEAGLEIIEDTKPDVVITDIRMPIMDGISMTEQIRQRYENVLVIIISGYDDFEYARRALKLGVSEYIMKPIDIEQFKSTMEAIREKLNSQFRKKSEFDKLKSYEQYNKQKLMKDAFADIVQDNPVEGIHDDFLTELEELYFCVGISEKENFPIISIDCDYLQLMELDRQFENALYAKTHLPEHGEHTACIKMNTCERIICVWGKTKEEVEAYVKVISRNFDIKNHDTEENFSISFGEVHMGRKGLRQSFDDARTRHNDNYRVVWDNIIHSNGTQESSFEFEFDTENLFNEIKNGDHGSISTQFGLFERALNNTKVVSYFQTVLLTSSLLKEIMKLPDEIGGSSEEIFGNPMEYYLKIMANTKRTEVLDCLKEACYIVNDYFRDVNSDKLAVVFKRAANYMQKEFANEGLMLKDVAKNAYISTSYLSVIIKKETGKTFIEYLTDIRMAQARKLLLDTNLKSYEIAEVCGFSNPTYFSTVFKGVYGVSPSVFRKENEKKV